MIKLNRLYSKIDNVNHLPKEIKQRVFEVIAELREFLDNDLIDNVILPDKIPLKLSKVQVISLFQLLFDSGNVSDIDINDMFRLVEKYFKYDNNGSFHEISKAKIYADQLFTRAEKYPTLAIKKLNQKFSRILI